MTNKYNNINNNKKNKNNNDNGDNDDDVKFLMTKTLMIVIMEELVTITLVTVILMTYKPNYTEKN